MSFLRYHIKIEAWDKAGRNKGIHIQWLQKDVKTLEAAKHAARIMWKGIWSGYKKELTIFDKEDSKIFSSSNFLDK